MSEAQGDRLLEGLGHQARAAALDRPVRHLVDLTGQSALVQRLRRRGRLGAVALVEGPAPLGGARGQDADRPVGREDQTRQASSSSGSQAAQTRAGPVASSGSRQARRRKSAVTPSSAISTVAGRRRGSQISQPAAWAQARVEVFVPTARPTG